jgi:predicted dinucleotide-binding enzyme
VKCFNIITAGEMVEPDLVGGPPTMFLAGDDDAAKETVIGVLHDFGWPDVVDVGGIEGARLLEPLCLLWVVVGARRGAWDHGFRLLLGTP